MKALTEVTIENDFFELRTNLGIFPWIEDYILETVSGYAPYGLYCGQESADNLPYFVNELAMYQAKLMLLLSFSTYAACMFNVRELRISQLLFPNTFTKFMEGYEDSSHKGVSCVGASLLHLNLIDEHQFLDYASYSEQMLGTERGFMLDITGHAMSVYPTCEIACRNDSYIDKFRVGDQWGSGVASDALLMSMACFRHSLHRDESLAIVFVPNQPDF